MHAYTLCNVEYWYALYMENKIPDAHHAFNTASGQKNLFAVSTVPHWVLLAALFIKAVPICQWAPI